MIEPAEILLEIGYIAGMFSTIIIGAVAVILNSKGEKTIAMEPVCKSAYGGEGIEVEEDERYYLCPICEGTVGAFSIYHNYCPKCGQAIDWSE